MNLKLLRSLFYYKSLKNPSENQHSIPLWRTTTGEQNPSALSEIVLYKNTGRKK